MMMTAELTMMMMMMMMMVMTVLILNFILMLILFFRMYTSYSHGYIKRNTAVGKTEC
jgi:hypothetical protein